MATYNYQNVFPCSASTPVVVACLVGTGQVTIEKPVGASWVVTDRVLADGAQSYWLGNGLFRVTPTGTAQYEIS